MLEDVTDLKELLREGDSELLTIRFGEDAPLIIYAVRAKTAQLIIKSGDALPVINGKTSCGCFGQHSKAKLEPILQETAAPGAEIADSIFINGSTNYYHFLMLAFPFLPFLGTRDYSRLFLANAMPESVSAFIVEQFLPKVTSQAVNISVLPDGVYSARNMIFPIINSNYHVIRHFFRNVILPMHLKSGLRDIAAPAERTRLFVRRDTPHRKLVNENEIEDWLLFKGYQSIDPGRMSFQEQAITFANASHIVGATGAALANIVFAASPEQVVELAPLMLRKERFISAIAEAAGANVNTLYGESIAGAASSRNDDFVLPLERLKAIEHLI